MRTINSRLSWLIGFCLALAPAGAISAEGRACLGYSFGGVLHLLASSGEEIRSVKAARPIREFGVSPDATRVAFSTAPLSSYGGQLYILTVSSGEVVGLKHIRSVSEPIYSDPEFSPDGRQIAFAVHGSRNGDLVEASGPLAVANVETGSVSVLKATEDIGGNGTAYANEPHWSPDSHLLLFSFETGAAVVDSRGEHLRDLTSLMEQGGTEKWTHALGWVGSGCVAYIAGSTPGEAARNRLKILRLRDGKSLSADNIIAGADVTNLVAFSPGMQVFKTPTGVEVRAASKTWKLPISTTRGVVVRLIPNTEISEVAKACE